MKDTTVSVKVRVASFRRLAECVAALPEPFRPEYFTLGGRVRNKEASRIDDAARFAAFLDDRVAKVSGFELIGEGIRFGFYVGATRDSRHQSTHVGCSTIVRGRRWKITDYGALLKHLCSVVGVEEADACRREEWTHRHMLVKHFAGCSVQPPPLGVNISASLPGLYWWTVFSDQLATRHRLDVAELAVFAGHHERWFTEDGDGLHAFRLYDSPDDWEQEQARVTAFLDAHPNFFSMSSIANQVEAADSRDALDAVVRPYWTGAVPWE